MVYIKLSLLIFISFLLVACTRSNINIQEYKGLKEDKVIIKDSCKDYYNNKKVKVAVVNFTNNSSFESANITDKNSNTTIGLDIANISAGSKKNKLKTTRVANANLSKAFVPQIENIILNTSGVELYTREDFNKINDELKLQDSGLLDSSTIVEFGKLSGVKYLITGSIDYIEHNFKNYSKYSKPVLATALHTDNDKLKLASLAFALGSTFMDGTKIKTAVTVKILDVATSKIVFSKQIKKETSISSSSKSSYDEIIGAVKSTINEALPTLQEHLNDKFPSYTYVNKIKTNEDKLLVQLALGKNDYIKKDDIFVILDSEESTDPLTGKKTCSLYKSDNKLIASEHITQTNTYTTILDGNNKDIKLLQLVQKIQE